MYSFTSVAPRVGFRVFCSSERIAPAWNTLPVIPVILALLEPLAEPGNSFGLRLSFFFLITTTRRVR